MKIAIVTGASSGMGKEFVRQIERFYRELDEIWVIARSEKNWKRSRKPQDLYPDLAGDMEEDLVYKQVKNRLENQNPDIRMLVNAAGFGKTGTIEEIAKEDRKLQLRMIDLNCRGLTEMTCTCLPWMHKGTRIINLASAAAFCPQAKFAVYAATKSYVLSFSRSLAAELKEKGIFVTAVCPGPVDTPFFEVSGKLPGGMKEAVMADPVQVVKQALIDAKYKKEVSVYGTAMKGAEAATKVLPHGMILKAMSMIEKITKE